MIDVTMRINASPSDILYDLSMTFMDLQHKAEDKGDSTQALAWQSIQTRLENMAGELCNSELDDVVLELDLTPDD